MKRIYWPRLSVREAQRQDIITQRKVERATAQKITEAKAKEKETEEPKEN